MAREFLQSGFRPTGGLGPSFFPGAMPIHPSDDEGIAAKISMGKTDRTLAPR
jgi:hypothetical protein